MRFRGVSSPSRLTTVGRTRTRTGTNLCVPLTAAQVKGRRSARRARRGPSRPRAARRAAAARPATTRPRRAARRAATAQPGRTRPRRAARRAATARPGRTPVARAGGSAAGHFGAWLKGTPRATRPPSPPAFPQLPKKGHAQRQALDRGKFQEVSAHFARGSSKPGAIPCHFRQPRTFLWHRLAMDWARPARAGGYQVPR